MWSPIFLNPAGKGVPGQKTNRVKAGTSGWRLLQRMTVVRGTSITIDCLNRSLGAAAIILQFMRGSESYFWSCCATSSMWFPCRLYYVGVEIWALVQPFEFCSRVAERIID